MLISVSANDFVPAFNLQVPQKNSSKILLSFDVGNCLSTLYDVFVQDLSSGRNIIKHNNVPPPRPCTPYFYMLHTSQEYKLKLAIKSATKIEQLDERNQQFIKAFAKNLVVL